VVETIAFVVIMFLLVGWPLITYADDIVRYVVWWLKGERR